MARRPCADVERYAADLAAGVRDVPGAAGLRAHAAECAACGRTLALEARLQSALAALPPGGAPPPAPAVPDAPRIRLLGGSRLPWAAAAAALVAAATVASWNALQGAAGAPDADRDAAAAGLRVVDEDGPAAPWDDRLLELTAGAEAVAARKPAEGR